MPVPDLAPLPRPVLTPRLPESLSIRTIKLHVAKALHHQKVDAHNPMAGAGRPSSLSVVAKSSGKLLLSLLSITRKHAYAA
jgi:hypothetical protein